MTTPFSSTRIALTLVLAAAVILATACGQKGPLVLPGRDSNDAGSRTGATQDNDTQHNDTQHNDTQDNNAPATTATPLTTE